MIPKCAAQVQNEIKFNGEYQVVKDDPLIMWQFDQIKNEVISYSINREIPEACRKLFKTIIVKDIDMLDEAKPEKSYFTAKLYILIALVIILLYIRFKKSKSEKEIVN